MDQLKVMKIFVNIVESGSLTAAANQLESSPASIARALSALEKSLKVRLINRNTRKISVTQEGLDYFQWCKHILNEMDFMQHSFEQNLKTSSGLLKITAPIEFGNVVVAPLVNEYLQTYPDRTIQLILNDRCVDLVQDHYDLAIRIGHLADSSLIASCLGHTTQMYCVSPEFKHMECLNHPEDLRTQDCIVFSDFGQKWKFLVHDTEIMIPVKATLLTNQISVAKKACIQGLGVGQFYHYQVQDALKKGDLVEVFKQYRHTIVPIHLIYPYTSLVPLRVKYFIEWFKTKFIYINN